MQRWPSGFRFPGGESFLELQSRLTDTVERICKAHPGEVVVAVSHADCIKAVLAGALGVPLDLFQRIVVAPCSISTVVYGPDGPAVLAMGSTSAPARPAEARERPDERGLRASGPGPGDGRDGRPGGRAHLPAPGPCGCRRS